MKGLKGKRILITGATGFIGSRLAVLAEAAGAELHFLVRRSSRSDRLGGLWNRAARHVGDMADAAALAACVKAADPEYVFHLAKDRECASFQKEAAATLRLAAALKSSAPGLKRWVRTALDARDQGREADMYLAKSASEKFALSIVTLELFSVYGPGQGDEDFPIPFLRDLEAGRAARELSSGEAGVQDFVFVDDAAAAYLAAAVSDCAGATIPIGTGQPRTRAAVVGLIMEKFGLQAPGMGSGPAAALEGHAADASLAERLLGWRAKTDLSAGLDKLIAWRRGRA